MSFECTQNHLHSIDQLLEKPSTTLEEELQGLIRSWEDILDRLVDMVKQARSLGHSEMINIVNRQILRIEERIRTAEKALAGRGRSKRGEPEPPKGR